MLPSGWVIIVLVSRVFISSMDMTVVMDLSRKLVVVVVVVGVEVVCSR